MGIPVLDKRIVYWKIEVGDNDFWSTIMQDVVASVSITYELKKPPRAVISLISVSYIEDAFYVGTKVTIWMGYDPLNLVHMLTGKIMKLPQGEAQEVMSYSIEVEGNVPPIYAIEQNRMWGRFPKKTIIDTIAVANGMKSDVLITDVVPFEKNAIPMQKAKTDYDFLVECAKRWECEFWFSYDALTGITTLHFYDAIIASSKGDINKTIHLGDLGPVYILGYRSFDVLNNVQSVKWGFEAKRSGTPGSISFVETGETEKPDDWVISYRGQRWELKDKYIKEAGKDPRRWEAYLLNTIQNGVTDVETTVRKYFRQVPNYSKNNQDTYNNEPIKLIVELNMGDPYLRPPRSAFLISGTPDSKAASADLPQLIYEGENELTALFRMKKVTTNLDAGKLSTTIELTRNITGGL